MHLHSANILTEWCTGKAGIAILNYILESELLDSLAFSLENNCRAFVLWIFRDTFVRSFAVNCKVVSSFLCRL